MGSYVEITDNIVTTYNLSIYDSSYSFKNDLAGLKATNILTGEQIIFEGDRVPDISIENNANTDWISATLDDVYSPTYININVLYMLLNASAKIYLKYDGVSTNNYIYIESIQLAKIVLYNPATKKYITINPYLLSNNHPAIRLTPIGIEVIPLSHNVYGNNKIGVMSLKLMDYNTPITGTTDVCRMYFGNNIVSDTVLSFNIVNNTDPLTIKTTGSWGRMPLDLLKNTVCLHDKNLYYYKTSENMLAGPYLTDGSRNPIYYNDALLSDFDGAGNSELLLNNATALPDWRTDSSIINSVENGYQTAACCCYRYLAGDLPFPGLWYIPTLGEAGYFLSRSLMILNSILKVIDWYGSDTASIYNDNLMTSTKCINSGAYYYISNSGYCGTLTMTSNPLPVRAFRLILLN